MARSVCFHESGKTLLEAMTPAPASRLLADATLSYSMGRVTSERMITGDMPNARPTMFAPPPVCVAGALNCSIIQRELLPQDVDVFCRVRDSLEGDRVRG